MQLHIEYDQLLHVYTLDIQLFVHIHVIFVAWVSTVPGVCTLSAVLCIPKGEAFALGDT